MTAVPDVMTAVPDVSPPPAPPLLKLIWTDPVTRCRGRPVVDRLVHGAARDGLRMRRGCTLAEVSGPAAG
ncbi:hypothetical protein QCN29_04645 [Streptomyces sp. HNM0663]|uniref:Uncharacterized protein n=1 Tax=Streptomyces chengmaiensis TaxID=3040919 RepID=A0ABT6HHM3_9ACTN|nr:hypothetical protein [Streptomyces chengmaiensis]MDH2388086.1 hypothetical protein [Streptomyces chengmaiensis]